MEESDTMAAVFGIAPSALPKTYDAFLAFVHSEDRERVQSAVAQGVTQADAFTVEFRSIAAPNEEIIEPTVLDLNVVVTDMRAMLERLIREDVKVVLNLRPELAPVKVDRGQVELVEQRPALKVIYMSGYTEDAIVHHGVLNPGIAFLHKPFTSETLGRKIREVLDRSVSG